MLVAEFTVSEAILHSTLSAFNTIHITYEAQYRTADDGVRLLFWLSGVEASAFEIAVDDDPTVTDCRLIDADDSVYLYRVDLTQSGRSKSTFLRWAEDDVGLLNGYATQDGWQLEMRFPDRETLIAYREAYVANGCSFFLLSLYQRSADDQANATSLTSAQRELLVEAYESGYFDIPRRITQNELASQFAITSQSVSERLRRGIASLIESMLRRK
ncbi:helix-turn-helix domain-containing protein [Natronorubrum sp. DTA7]|uniref:helix-turn-helix domain-containing protein n=1 Tax=Natronorubrum sp. DTA7 TaxID=3447016 RepID=UPI003F827248